MPHGHVARADPQREPRIARGYVAPAVARCVLEQQIEEVDRQIQDKIRSFGLSESYALLQTVPGMKKEAAATVLAEVGANVDAFSTPAKLSSWAGVCPGNNESADKRKSTRTTKGNPYLRDMLLEHKTIDAKTLASMGPKK